MSEMQERVAEAVRRSKFERTGRGRVYQPGICSPEELAEALAAIQELGEPTAEMLKGGMEVLEASQKMGEPLEAQVGRVWWEMICIAQPMPERTKEDDERWEKLLAEAKMAAGIAETGT